MLILERKGCEVFCNGVKLKINPQKSKGENKEVVSIKGLEGSNGQDWISLNKLQEGINEIDTKKRVIKNGSKYYLTEEERLRVEELDKEKENIIENAKKRYENLKKFETNKESVKDLSKQEREDMINYLMSLQNKED